MQLVKCCVAILQHLYGRGKGHLETCISSGCHSDYAQKTHVQEYLMENHVLTEMCPGSWKKHDGLKLAKYAYPYLYCLQDHSHHADKQIHQQCNMVVTNYFELF